MGDLEISGRGPVCGGLGLNATLRGWGCGLTSKVLKIKTWGILEDSSFSPKP